MPTYVYECSACEKVFEVEQRITENALTDCPCGSEGTVKRLIQPTAIMFKGSGFYVTDSNAKSPTTVPAPSENVPSTDVTPTPVSVPEPE